MVIKKRKVVPVEECISRHLKFLCPSCFNAFYEDIGKEIYRERDNKNNIGRRSYGRTDYPSFMLNMRLKTLIELDVDEIRDIEFS